MSRWLGGFPKDIACLEQALQRLSEGELAPEPRLKHRATGKGTALPRAAPGSGSAAAAASCLTGAAFERQTYTAWITAEHEPGRTATLK